MHHRIVPLILALATCATAQTAAPKGNAASAKPALAATSALPSEETVNAFLNQTWGYNPGLSWKIASIRPSQIKELAEVTVIVSTPQGQQQARFFVAPDGRHALIGDIIPFGAQPFEPLRKELAAKVTGPSTGPSTAQVTIVDFSDLQCPHCKAAHPLLTKLLEEDKNVRVVFQQFPLPAHDWAEKAAAYSDCIAHVSNPAFWKFLESVYNAQNEITGPTADEKLNTLANQVGMKSDEISACAAKDETVGRVQASIALGKAVDVNATPTFFINGRRVANLGQLSYEELKSLVDFAARNGK